jgi:hypothetical protein
MGSKKNKNGSPRPPMAAPSPAVFLSHGRELMGNAEKDHLLQRTEVVRFHSLFRTSPILCIYQNSNLRRLFSNDNRTDVFGLFFPKTTRYTAPFWGNGLGKAAMFVFL